jgi:formamidopyrimidine-DNA glycosylase
MSGRLLIEERRRRDKHDHIVISFTESSKRLIFRDIRKFGIIEWLGDKQQEALDQLGPEATDVTSNSIRQLLQSSTRPVKAFLLDQHRIAGLGNIYVDEALYRSRLHPLTPCNIITNAESGRLARAIRYILRTAIDKMGTTFDSYSGVNGNPGEYANYLCVYGQEGNACPRCKSEVVKITAVGRGTHFCPHCQPLRVEYK